MKTRMTYLVYSALRRITLGLLLLVCVARLTGELPPGYIPYTDTPNKHWEIHIPPHKKAYVKVSRARDEPTHIAILRKDGDTWTIVAECDVPKNVPSFLKIFEIDASDHEQIVSATGTWNNSQNGAYGGILATAAHGRVDEDTGGHFDDLVFSTNSNINEFNTVVKFLVNGD